MRDNQAREVLSHVLAGKKKPSGKSLRQAAENMAEKTVKNSTQHSLAPQSGYRGVG